MRGGFAPEMRWDMHFGGSRCIDRGFDETQPPSEIVNARCASCHTRLSYSLVSSVMIQLSVRLITTMFTGVPASLSFLPLAC
jgi:hypothetical protein